jgi:DNA polymerase gamma 1
MELTDVLELQNLPFDPLEPMQWFEIIGKTYWEDIGQMCQKFSEGVYEFPFESEASVKSVPPTGIWHRYSDRFWSPIDLDELPEVLVFDLESSCVEEEGRYRPFLACAFGIDGEWYAWQVAPQSAELVPFPMERRIIIGHNIFSYDRRYLECEYLTLKSQHIYVDTLCLATIIYGLGEDDKDNEMIATWKAHKAAAMAGKGTPTWFQHACTAGLEELSYFLLGEKIDKSVREELKKPTSDLFSVVAPSTVLEYCLQDVWTTFKVFRELFTKVNKQFFKSACSWTGLQISGHTRIFLKNWREFLQTNEERYQEIIKSHRELIRGIAEEECRIKPWDSKVRDIDWVLSPRSKWAKQNPGRNPHKWLIALEEKDYSLGVRITVQLLQLRWKGERISYIPKGKSGTWVSDSGEELPHPSGMEANLSSPLCAKYLPHAETGILTSDRISQEQLISLIEESGLLTQWKSYRKRYASVWSYSSEWGDYVICDLNPCGTVTRRATSKLWEVVPGKSKKLGSNATDYLGAPEEYSVVGMDFDAQESGLAVVLTDAQTCQVMSSAWTKMILLGNSKDGTDNHSVIAKRFGIPRNPIAKGVNFAAQYGAGEEKIALTIFAGVKDKTMQECRHLAKDFFLFMKGPNGIARTTFQTLKEYANTPGLRTMILRVRIPESLDVLWAQNQFVTTRNNWTIQSPGQDMLHLLLTGIWAYGQEYDLDYFLLLGKHDAAYFAVRKGQEELFRQCCQSVHYRLKLATMHQARKQAVAFHGVRPTDGKIEDFVPLENHRWFAAIKVGERFSDV